MYCLLQCLFFGTLALQGAKASADERSVQHALMERSTSGHALTRPLDRGLLGKGCAFCINVNIQANFDKLAQAISGVASDVKDVENTLQQMSANFTREMQQIAHGIEDLAQSVESLGATMLLHIVAMRGFLNAVKAEIDLGILVQELQTSLARIEHRQTLLDPLLHDKGALTPQQKQDLVTAILDINEGSDIDTEIIHDVLVGAGGVVPGVKPALEVYMKQGYKLDQLSKVFGALFVYQMHGYGQLFWADLNKRPDINLLPYNETQNVSSTRLNAQWREFGSPFMWHCYWDDGFVCPEFQECHAGLRGLSAFACNYAIQPLTIDVTTGNQSFTFGAASSDLQLQFLRNAPSGTCLFGVKDCQGQILAPIPYNLTSGAVNFTCSAAAVVELVGGVLSLYPNGTGATGYILANVSASNYSTYALFMNETGEVTIVGNNATVLWTHAAPPAPTSGPCATDFTKRQLEPITFDSCKCITSARWRSVASNKINMTASWCGRLCQADPQYVASAPRGDGECWCATPDVYHSTVSGFQNCNATCPYCPGAPVEACGVNNSVAVFTWASAKKADEAHAIMV